MEIEQQLIEMARVQDRTCLLVEQLTEKVEERTQSSDAWRKRVEQAVWGLNGSADKSLMVRMDRLEQAHKTKTWVVRTVSGVFIAGAATAMWVAIVG